MRKTNKKMKIFTAIFDAIRNKPETISFPCSPLILPKGYRGNIIMLDPEQCSGCGLCVRDCPAQALELRKDSRTEFRLIYYPARCAYCGQCVESCRNQAITHSNQLAESTSTPNASVIVLKDTLDQDEEDENEP